MKILFYNHTGQVSGAERVLLMILSRLDQSRFQPVVVCPETGRLLEMVSELKVRAIGLEQLEARFTWRPDQIFRYLWSFFRVIRAARAVVVSEAPGLIHANSIRAGLVMALATAGLRVPVIWHGHDILPRHPLSSAIRLVALASGRNRLLAVSHAVAVRFRGELLRWFDRRVPVRVIHNAADLRRFRPNSISRRHTRRALNLTDSQPLIGAVGQLTERKGQRELIEAFGKIAEAIPDAVLLIVGEPIFNRDSDYAGALRQLAQARGLAQRVRFLGARDDVPALMQALDVLVVNSHAEPFALTVLEGLASGITVLGTAVGGTPEMIEHDQNGWLVPARDVPALAEALHTLVRTPELRLRLGLSGRTAAEARFSTERFLREIEELYRDTTMAGGEMPQYRSAKAIQLSAD